jgi:hypothetical protein
LHPDDQGKKAVSEDGVFHEKCPVGSEETKGKTTAAHGRRNILPFRPAKSNNAIFWGADQFFRSFNPEPTATANPEKNTVAVGSGLNDF